MKLIAGMMMVASALGFSPLLANTVINNNYGTAQGPGPGFGMFPPVQTAPQPAQSSSCNPNVSQPQGMPPGHYVIKNGNGSVDNVYTTGDKNPYIVDNPCNNTQAVIQPYIGINTPVDNGGGGIQPVQPIRPVGPSRR